MKILPPRRLNSVYLLRLAPHFLFKVNHTLLRGEILALYSCV
jgi:hypothetical protein